LILAYSVFYVWDGGVKGYSAGVTRDMYLEPITWHGTTASVH
jgi:hypothetical protein